ncbi:MAG: carbohydrate porin [Gammaproteobacteria bacterium]|nr:carbohydrate porin [Gammaproteobacteria bacterium]
MSKTADLLLYSRLPFPEALMNTGTSITAVRPQRRSAIIAVIAASAVFGSAVQAETVLAAYYRADVMSNTSGGLDTGTAYVDDAGLTFRAELDALFGGNEARLSATLLYNNPTTFSDRYVGDLQVVSNFDAPRGTRIYELWYEEAWSDAYSLRVGLYDLNSEFDVIDTAGLFINSSHGIGAEYALTGENGPSIFPVTSLTARFDWAISESSSLRYALLDAVPGDVNDVGKTSIRLSGDEGALHALEFNYQLQGGARFGVGGWLYSADFELIEGTNVNGDPLRDDGNAGVYGFVDTPLPLGAEDVNVNAFLRYGIANDDINTLRSYIGGGVVVTGLVGSRPDDQFGLAFASARIGDPFERSIIAAGGAVKGSETSIELTYSAQINDWLRIQPDIQYVINPGADASLDDAFVIGLRFHLSASKIYPTEQQSRH